MKRTLVSLLLAGFLSSLPVSGSTREEVGPGPREMQLAGNTVIPVFAQYGKYHYRRRYRRVYIVRSRHYRVRHRRHAYVFRPRRVIRRRL